MMKKEYVKINFKKINIKQILRNKNKNKICLYNREEVNNT